MRTIDWLRLQDKKNRASQRKFTKLRSSRELNKQTRKKKDCLPRELKLSVLHKSRPKKSNFNVLQKNKGAKKNTKHKNFLSSNKQMKKLDLKTKESNLKINALQKSPD